MIKLLYTVTEISEELGFSRVTIYNKIKLLKSDLKGSIKHKNGVMCLDSKGIVMLKNELGINSSKEALHNSFTSDNSKAEGNNGIDSFKGLNEIVNTLNNSFKEGQEEYVNSLLSQIELLKIELDKKDKQLDNKDIQLNNTLRLLENSQVLLKNNKKEILQLEDKEQKEAREKLTLWQRIKKYSKGNDI